MHVKLIQIGSIYFDSCARIWNVRWGEGRDGRHGKHGGSFWLGTHPMEGPGKALQDFVCSVHASKSICQCKTLEEDGKAFQEWLYRQSQKVRRYYKLRLSFKTPTPRTSSAKEITKQLKSGSDIMQRKNREYLWCLSMKWVHLCDGALETWRRTLPQICHT